ncbi:MAG: peptide deformylase [Candidatus Abyssobacteria bacterium SURF_5]|uniref:Peptide deformylase n=1 Tax=Abyssobacteria bacterium (strain SURF_5) TaxID=2093360 RepID=A0A3A4NZG1_ABYX5|nr:MAG: peptide deformylase [Candidatus Abyssubacteria bacterium SURF_5]
MSKLQLTTYPAPILRKQAEPVKNVDGELIQTAEEMFTLMYENRGIGLAAPQAGISRRLLVIDLREDNQPVYIMINPQITKREGLVETEEGCLSLPEIFGDVKRAERVQVSFIDRDGESRILEAEGMLARAVQHEIDHLNGVLFIDRIGETRRQLLTPQLRALAEAFEGKNGNT